MSNIVYYSMLFYLLFYLTNITVDQYNFYFKENKYLDKKFTSVNLKCIKDNKQLIRNSFKYNEHEFELE